MHTPTVKRVSVRYSGRVQGVGFRATTVSLIHGDPIVGWVRNESDGSVELEAQAPPNVLTQFLARIDQAMGPKIHQKTVQWIDCKEGEKYFSIRYS